MLASRTVRWAALAVVVLGCSLVVRVLAKEDKDKPAKEEPLVLRMYDVEGLFFPRKDRPCPRADLPIMGDASQLVQWQTLVQDFPAPTPACGSGELQNVIQRCVSSQSDPSVAAWSDEGGPATIEYLAPVLIITQTPAAHKKIEDLLDQYRKRLNCTLTIQAKWVQVDADKAAKILAGRAGADGQAVSAAALNEAGGKTLYQGHVQGFDRQLVHMVSGEYQIYIPGAKPVFSGGAVACEPTLHDALFGAVLEVRPILVSDGQSATLDVRSFVTELNEMRVKSLPDFGQAKGGAQPMKLDLDLPSVLVHTFASTAKAPLGKPVLVGSMTQAGDKAGKVLFLIMEVSATK